MFGWLVGWFFVLAWFGFLQRQINSMVITRGKWGGVDAEEGKGGMNGDKET